jgi:hypothetical protein
MKVSPPETMGTNLARFVDEVRAVGAEPILVTSLTRRNFNSDNVTLNDTLGPWANGKPSLASMVYAIQMFDFPETILISQQKKTHLLDLHKWSMWYVEKIGPDAAHRLNRLPADNTHLNANGTTVFGRCVCIMKSWGVGTDEEMIALRLVADLMAVELLPDVGPIIPNIPLSTKIWTGQAVY